MTSQSRPLPAEQGAMLLLVVLVGLNLRPFITGPGPVMEMIRTGTGLSYVGMSLMTLLPFLLMGVGAFISPRLQARWGTRRGLLTALALLMLGSGLRLVVPNGASLLFTALLCGMGVAFVQSVFPGITLLARGQDRRPWLWLTLVLQGIGFAGLLFQPGLAPWLWVAVCGMGLGGNFSMSLVTALDHLPVPQQAGALAALMQGGGFLLAAMGPLAVSLLQQASGSFAGGWALHLGLVAVVLLTTLQFDPRRYARVMAQTRA